MLEFNKVYEKVKILNLYIFVKIYILFSLLLILRFLVFKWMIEKLIMLSLGFEWIELDMSNNILRFGNINVKRIIINDIVSEKIV